MSKKRCRYCGGGAVDLVQHEQNCLKRPQPKKRERRSKDEREMDAVDREIAVATRQKPAPKGNWEARMRVTVIKTVRLENCTEAEAKIEPWEHATHEQEMSQLDWQIETLKKVDA